MNAVFLSSASAVYRGNSRIGHIYEGENPVWTAPGLAGLDGITDFGPEDSAEIERQVAKYVDMAKPMPDFTPAQLEGVIGVPSEDEIAFFNSVSSYDEDFDPLEGRSTPYVYFGVEGDEAEHRLLSGEIGPGEYVFDVDGTRIPKRGISYVYSDSGCVLSAVLRQGFADADNMKYASLPTVLSVGDESFMGCSELTSASFASAVYVGEAVFEADTKLKDVGFGSIATKQATADAARWGLYPGASVKTSDGEFVVS